MQSIACVSIDPVPRFFTFYTGKRHNARPGAYRQPEPYEKAERDSVALQVTTDELNKQP